jgi:hypothetical protein
MQRGVGKLVGGADLIARSRSDAWYRYSKGIHSCTCSIAIATAAVSPMKEKTICSSSLYMKENNLYETFFSSKAKSLVRTRFWSPVSCVFVVKIRCFFY